LKVPVLSPQSDKAYIRTKFKYPCIKLLVPPPITREYHYKVRELLHLLQCIAAYLQRTLRLFSADVYSRLVARSCKPIKNSILENLFRGCKQHQIFRKKQAVDPAASNSDTLIDAAV